MVTYCRASPSKKTLGLLFHNDDGHSEEELRAIVAHNDVRDLLGPIFFGTILQWGPSNYYRSHYYNQRPTEWIPSQTGHREEAYYLAPQLWYPPTVLHPQTAPILFRAHDHIGRYDTMELYTNCMAMQKFIDCSKCEDFGTNCLIVNVPDPLPQTLVCAEHQLCLPEITKIQLEELAEVHEQENGFMEIDDWAEKRFRSWKATIAGYTVIPSTATADDALRPGVDGARPPFKHGFGGLERIREELSNRTKNGVHTRETRRTQCSKCYFGGTHGKHVSTCEKWAPRACTHGAWTEEEIVETTIQGMEPKLKASGFDLETLWRVSLVAGHRFKRGRQEWMVSRMRHKADCGMYIELARTARKQRGELQGIMSFDEIYKTLPDAAKERLDRNKEIDRRELALMVQLSVPNEGKGYCCYHEGYIWYQPKIAYARLQHNWKAELGIWGRTYEREITFRLEDGFARMVDYFGDLPFFSRLRWGDKEYDDSLSGYRFTHWVR